MATGCMLLKKIERDLHGAAVSADPERLERGVEDLFAPNARIAVGPSARVVRPSDLLPTWLSEIEAWTPQGYEILTSVDAGNAVAYEYLWSARHTGRLRLPDGREIEPTGITVVDRVAIFARWDGSRVTYCQSYFSRYPVFLSDLISDCELGATAN
jgi:hypothetical protein